MAADRQPTFCRQPAMPACAAYGCTERPSKKIPGITFHRFVVLTPQVVNLTCFSKYKPCNITCQPLVPRQIWAHIIRFDIGFEYSNEKYLFMRENFRIECNRAFSIYFLPNGQDFSISGGHVGSLIPPRASPPSASSLACLLKLVGRLSLLPSS